MSVVARGSYFYSRDGERQLISEPWTLSADAGRLRLQGQRLVNGKTALEVDAEYDNLRCISMHVCWHGAPEVRKVHYQRSGDSLHWQMEGAEQPHTAALPPDGELFPLLRAGAGPLVKLLMRSARAVTVPDIRATAGAGELLAPLHSRRHAVLQREDENGQHCRYYGGEYGDVGSDYWLDKRGLLQRYRWASAQGEWEAQLEDLHLSTGFAGF